MCAAAAHAFPHCLHTRGKRGSCELHVACSVGKGYQRAGRDSRLWCLLPCWKSRMKTACCWSERVCCHCSTGRARKRAPRDARARHQLLCGRVKVSSGFARHPPVMRGNLSEANHSHTFLPPTRCWPPCPCCAQRALSVAPLLACVRGGRRENAAARAGPAPDAPSREPALVRRAENESVAPTAICADAIHLLSCGHSQ